MLCLFPSHLTSPFIKASVLPTDFLPIGSNLSDGAHGGTTAPEEPQGTPHHCQGHQRVSHWISALAAGKSLPAQACRAMQWSRRLHFSCTCPYVELQQLKGRRQQVLRSSCPWCGSSIPRLLVLLNSLQQPPYMLMGLLLQFNLYHMCVCVCVYIYKYIYTCDTNIYALM